MNYFHDWRDLCKASSLLSRVSPILINCEVSFSSRSWLRLNRCYVSGRLPFRISPLKRKTWKARWVTLRYYFMPEAHLRGVEGIVEKQLTTALVLLGFVLWLVEERMKKKEKKRKKKNKTLFVFILVVVIFFFVPIGQRDYFGFGCATCNRIA